MNKWKIAFFFLFAICICFAFKRFYYQQTIMPEESSAWWKVRTEIFAGVPLAPGSLLFLGDSHIEYSPFAEEFGGVNRGICTEELHFLLKRLPEYLPSRPRALVILTGINDIVQGRKDIEKDFDSLFAMCRGQKLFLLQIMPMAAKYPGSGRINPEVDSINRFLKGRTMALGIPLIPTLDALADSVTWDGVHLNAAGYRALCDKIGKAIAVGTPVGTECKSGHCVNI